jgi:hypothetical protein
MDTGAALVVARERTVQALCHHFAHDRLTIDELDVRLATAQQASSVESLHQLLVGLPEVTRLPARMGEGQVSARPAFAEPARVVREERIAALMSERKRTGRWTVPERLRVVAVMSDVKLDLTEAELGPYTEIDASAWMSQVRVLVPRGVRLECTGGAVMGSFTERWENDVSLPSDAPVVRVTGLSVMAEVTVKVAAPKTLPPQGRWSR